MDCIIFIVDGWDFANGGINVFNRLLCEGMGNIQNSKIKVICVSQNVILEEIEAAKNNGVELVNIAEDEFTAENIVKNLEMKTMGRITFVGHDVKTGNLAIESASLVNKRCAILHHMSYASYYPIINRDSETSEKKIDEQRKILQSADIIFANGPLLEKSAKDIVGDAKEVMKIYPGIADITPRKNINNNFNVITFGRVEFESGMKRNNTIIKQTYLAVAAWANFTQKYLQEDQETTMKVYGKDETNNMVDLEMDQLISLNLDSVHAISSVKYEKDRNQLLKKLSEFSLCLVLSLREGFGLTALEAISAGVPLIVSKRSGFFEALKELRLDNYVLSVNIQGKTEPPYYSDQDLNNVTQKIYYAFTHQKEVKEKVLELRDKLKENGFTWNYCAQAIIKNYIPIIYHRMLIIDILKLMQVL